MFFFVSVLIIIGLSAAGYYMAKKRAVAISDISSEKLDSLPAHYGWCSSIWIVISSITVFIGLSIFKEKLSIHYLVIVLCVVVAAGLAYAAWHKLIKPKFKARKHLEKVSKVLLLSATFISILITFSIIASVLFESIRFFGKIPFFDFIFGLHWSPQISMRADQAGSSGSFGAVPVFLGTLLITLIAMLVAVPVGLFSAIYISEYSSRRFRDTVKPFLEVLAGVPTVVYGYFAAVTFGPMLRDLGANINLPIASESAFSAGIVMGIMIIPFVLSLSDDVMNAVPRSLRDGSLALGSTKSETVVKVVVPAALPGIMGAVLLAISRGIGETMIVVMAAGLAAKLTLNPFETVTTVTAQIVTLLVGDQEFDSPKTLAAFALGLCLFVITLILNVIALLIVKKYRERYE